MTEEDKLNADNSKPESNLAAALYKMLGLKIDTEHKTAMRNLIINAEDDYPIAVIVYIGHTQNIMKEINKIRVMLSLKIPPITFLLFLH